MTRAAIYARISRDDGSALGVSRQAEDCRALIERHGWTAGPEFVDNDVSAYSGRRRPQYDALLEAVAAGEVEAIVAWHPDRLHRSPRPLEVSIDLSESTGCKVATVQAGELHLSAASGRMTARVVGAVARHESEQQAERMRRQKRQAAEMGLPGTGYRPFGYEP